MNHLPSANKPRVSIIIVAWNSVALLRNCLSSVRAATCGHAREVIVVDNASTEDVVGMVREEFPEVRLLPQKENLGFAAGNNLGMQAAKGDFYMLLNPDTELQQRDAVDILVDYLEANPDVAGAGPRLNFPDGRHQPGDAGFAPNAATAVSHALFLSRLPWRMFRGLYLVAPRTVNGATPMTVDWLCGAATIVRRSAVDVAGGLDESIFMYAEDVEWGCRMRDRGMALHYLPSVHVMHVGGASEKIAAGAAVSTRWLTSLARLYVRQGSRHWWTFKWSLAFGFSLRAAIYSSLSQLRRSSALQSRARAQWAYAVAATRLARTD